MRATVALRHHPLQPQTAEKLSPLRCLHRTRRELRAAAAGAAVVQTSNPLFNAVLCRSMADLSMLTTRNAARTFSLCGHSLVLDHVRPRRDPDHRGADAVGQSAHGARRAQPARGAAGENHGCKIRRRAGQDPARDARRRDGGARRGAVRALLRQRRLDAAVRACWRDSISSAPATSRPSRRCGRRSRRRSPGSTGPATATATASSNMRARPTQGLQNQGWKDSLDSVFHADGRLAEGPIALAEVQAYVYAAKRLLTRCAPADRAWRPGARARARGARARRALRARVLVSGHRDVRLGARRRQAAVPRAHLECRTGADERNRSSRACPAGRRRNDGA